MIRINLLGRERPRVKRRVPITGALQVALFLVPVGLAVVALFVHYGMIRSEITETEQEIAEKERQKAELAQVENDIKQLEEQRALAEKRKDMIERLEREQQGPVTLLEEVGRTVSLTETLWLTSMEQRGGNQIEFTGLAGSMEAVANFITNLSNSAYFEEVEIREAAQQPQGEGSWNFEFTLSAKFTPPATSKAEAFPEGEAPAAASGQP